MEALEEQLSYKFRDPELLQTALTHSTLSSNSNSSPLNTKKRTCDHLKILGDCVIKLLTSQYAICVSTPNDKVHKIVRIKDNLSNRYCQSLVGKSLHLEENGLIVTNLPQEQIFGHLDTFVKSLFGAIFLDAGGSEKKGLISCWKTFLKLWKPVITSYDAAKQLIDCFPEPIYSSREFLKERFSNFKVDDLKLLEEKIGYSFLKNPHLLEQAMTHDSIDMFRSSVDNPDPLKPEFVHFQNLEFLGDSVLELVIMEYLYLRSSSADPLGQMLFFNRDTGQKLYSSRFQIQVAKKLQLENFVIKPPQAPLASYDDFVESLIGSIYVHGRMVGLRICAKVVLEIWGLEEDVASTKQTSQKPEPVPVKISKADNKENIATVKPVVVKSVPASASVASPMMKPPPPPKQQPNKTKPNDLQLKIGYKFSNSNLLSYLPATIDVTSTDARAKSMNIINTCKNLQTVGRRVIDLVAVEYVIGLCHSTPQADLSAEMKNSFHSLRSTLVGDQVLLEIASKFELQRFWNLKQEDQTKPSTVASASEIIYLIFGAVFVDSSGDHSPVYNLFLRMWNSFTSGSKQPEPLIQCFPDTSENQQKFREAVTVRAPITIKMWTKLWYQLGHTCARKNLLEQALTDEKSQGYAKQQLNAYPLGNPFGLQTLGKSLVDLYVAYRCYLNTIAEPEIFPGLILRMDQSLFNVLKNTFDIERYYAHHCRYPYPPNKNPRAPFEALLGAVYVDVGGGGVGFRQMEAVIVKACPTLITMRRLKAVKQPVVPSSESGVDCSSPAKLSVSNSRQRGEDSVSDGGSASLSVVSSSSSPMKKGKQEELNTSFDSSQDNITSGKSTPLHTSFLTAAPVEQDPILSEFETKLAYKFVNPMLLRIVLEVNIPVAQQNCPVNSQNYFQIFKIIGNRALALLATEFALESLTIPKKADISAKDKKQVKSHRDHLTSPLVVDTIAKCISLDKYVFTSATKSDIPSNGDFITALMGAVFIDSRANYLKISALFNKLWKQNMNALPTHPILVQCFPLTTEGQAKLRNATSTQVADAKWKKFHTKLGHVFKNRNLLEQALTDENSQELAKTKHNAYPTGNPFALRLLGKCVIQLVIAYKTLPNAPDAQATNFAVGLENIEQALYNNFQNNFLGVDKYYACIKQQKNQKFPPKDNPFGPYQAVMGAVYVDSGTGNKGLDTVGMVIIKRSVGLKSKKKITTGPGLVDALPVPNGTPVSTRERALSSCSSSSNMKTSCSTPDPGANSSFCSESLNTSFSSKCAANFSISPSPVAPARKSSPKPLVKPREEPVSEEPCCSKTLISTPVPSAVPPKIPTPANSSTPKNSPKKQQKMQQQKSYASALISGKPVEIQPNKLFQAVTNAQSQIEALRKKQETIDHHRKLSIERQQKQQNDISDEISSNCSLPRSRCASTSTITSTGSQQQAVGDASGQKRKLGGKGGKKKNKKVKGVVPPKQVVPLQQQREGSPRVSAWCQNQMDRLQQEAPSSTSAVAGNAPSSCTTPEVHQQRSTVNQLQATRRGGMDENDEISIEFPSSPTRSAAVLGSNSQNGNYVPVHMVSGYRKTVVDGDRFGSKTKTAGGKLGSSELASMITGEDGEEEPPSGISYMSVLKWTSLILGVAFLLKRYGQGK